MYKFNNHTQIHIVFAVEHYNTTGLIRSLGEKGVNPVFIGIQNKCRISSKSKYISECFLVKTVEEGYQLLLDIFGNEYLQGEKPYIYCIDDKTVSYLDLHYDAIKEKFIFFNAGETGRLSFYMNKGNIAHLAKKYGLEVPQTIVCKRGEIPKTLDYPVITKSRSPIEGGWKSDTRICKTKEELAIAYKSIKAEYVVIQPYINKENEYVLEGFCANKGKDVFISISSTYQYLIDGYYSPYMTVQAFKNDRIESALKGMFKEIGYEGLFEAEFLLYNDCCYFLEINFRNSTWSYASTVAGMNLPILWYETMSQGMLSQDAKIANTKPFTAMVEPIDYQKRVVEKKMNKLFWIKELVSCKCLYYFNIRDLKPFFEMIKNNKKLR